MGFVLGYYLVKDGKDNSISEKHLKWVQKNLSIICGDKTVNMEDVLRYARLWLTQL